MNLTKLIDIIESSKGAKRLARIKKAMDKKEKILSVGGGKKRGSLDGAPKGEGTGRENFLAGLKKAGEGKKYRKREAARERVVKTGGVPIPEPEKKKRELGILTTRGAEGKKAADTARDERRPVEKSRRVIKKKVLYPKDPETGKIDTKAKPIRRTEKIRQTYKTDASPFAPTTTYIPDKKGKAVEVPGRMDSLEARKRRRTSIIGTVKGAVKKRLDPVVRTMGYSGIGSAVGRVGGQLLGTALANLRGQAADKFMDNMNLNVQYDRGPEIGASGTRTRRQQGKQQMDAGIRQVGFGEVDKDGKYKPGIFTAPFAKSVEAARQRIKKATYGTKKGKTGTRKYRGQTMDRVASRLGTIFGQAIAAKGTDPLKTGKTKKGTRDTEPFGYD
jgi:hypothetical protein